MDQDEVPALQQNFISRGQVAFTLKFVMTVYLETDCHHSVLAQNLPDVA